MPTLLFIYETKDNGGNENNLEVVILDVKTGQADLSQLQQAIAKAINTGRVRFEVVRHETFKQVATQKNTVLKIFRKHTHELMNAGLRLKMND